MNVPAIEFFRKGMEYAGRGHRVDANETNIRRFKSFFGTGAGGCEYVWRNLIPHAVHGYQGLRFYHLLWAQMFVKLYSTINVLSGIVKVDEKTFSKWVWIILDLISTHVKPQVIHLGLRFEGSNGAHQLLSVDGTDCPTNQKFDKSFYSHKFKGKFDFFCFFLQLFYDSTNCIFHSGSGVRYEVSLCIQTGMICSVIGPFPCGAWPDINIYRHWLKHQLLPNEKVEADAGYRGDETIRDPEDCTNWGEHEMKFNVRARHEHVNQRFKNFQCLIKFRHFTSQGDTRKHKLCFDTVATLVQVNMYCGDPLFPVQYVDY